MTKTVVMTKHWKCLNNSWADQTDFEDSCKKILKRMVFNMLLV
jgi:hypothetical protein